MADTQGMTDTPAELLGHAKGLLSRAAPETRGLWPRAAALLTGQALEQALDQYWQAKGLRVHECSTTAQLLCLTEYMNDTDIRVGSTNRRADGELIEEMRRFVRGQTYDELAMPELDSEALDFRAASELFGPVRKLKRRDLETLRLVTVHQGRRVPPSAECCCLARIGKGTSPMLGSKPVASRARTRPKSWTV